MILSVPVALLTALGPLLRGCWDLWSQLLMEAAVVAAFFFWICIRSLIGYVPLPSRRTLVWTAALLALAALSAARSPIYGLVAPSWYVIWTALWIFPAMSTVTKDQRAWIDEAIRISGWTLMVLAFYQHFVLHEDRPASALINENAYAGFVLMLIPLAAEKKDWLLFAGFLWTLCWTHSVGAWMGLSAALVITQRRNHQGLFWCGAGVMAICAVVIYSKLGTPEVLHRWWWWKAAWAMALDRPLTGYGPGSYAYILSAYLALKTTGLYTIYAHQYVLQTLADLGFPFAVIWFIGLWHCLERDSPHKRFAVIAVLLHSMWDYTLSVPANLWLFSYFAASSIPDGPEGINVRVRYKLPAIAAAVLLGSFMLNRLWRQWDGQQLSERAAEAFELGRFDEAKQLTMHAAAEIPADPEVPRIAAAIEMKSGSWPGAVVQLKKSIRLNPYRISSWNELALAYRKLGRADAAQQILMESQRYQAR